MPGWKDSTVGVKTLEGLPAAARAYIKRMEEVCGVPVDMISTGPDRDETIVLRHPFKKMSARAGRHGRHAATIPYTLLSVRHCLNAGWCFNTLMQARRWQ